MGALDKFNYEQLIKIKGQTLHVSDPQGNKLSVTISDVQSGAAHSADYQSFSTQFTDNHPNRIPQGSYTFSHKNIGEHYLFCTALSPTEYEIIINRSVGT